MAKTDKKEIFEALKLLEKEKGIPADYMFEKITKAVASACKNTYNNDDVVVDINESKGGFEAFICKEVAEQVDHENKQISLEDAKGIKKDAELGEKIKIKIDTKEFGRISVMTARNIIRQAIRDGERGVLMQEFRGYQNQIITAIVERIDYETGNVIVKIGETELLLPKTEQITGEIFNTGDYVKIYMVDVKDTEKGPRAVISRSHPTFIKKLFEKEVPEIHDGTVEIKSISREPGSRTKIAVSSDNANIDPVGTCIGTKGARVAAVVDEIAGEKIDIIEYSDDPEQFISSALAPADVVEVEIDDVETRACKATVPDNQISLAIGNKGQNVRLAAKLTGWKIDIVPQSGFYTGQDTDDADTED